MRNLAQRLRPLDRAALVAADGTRLSYRELHARVGTLAGGLFDLGLRPGDRVVLLLPMSFVLYEALLALWWVGATAVLVDPSGPNAKNLAKARPVGLIGTPKAHLLRLTQPALRGLDLAISTGFIPLPHRRLRRVRGAPPPLDDGRHPALLTFTTGTTGHPKGMARSHALLLAQHRALLGHMDLGPDDVDMPTLPVFLLHSLACSSTAVLADADLRHPGAIDPVRVIAQIRREGVTTISGSPAFFAPIAARLHTAGETLPGLRKLFLGGARVPSSLVSTLSEVCPNAGIFILYGSTEAEPIAVLDARAHLADLVAGEADNRGALVGGPIPEIAVRLDDEEILVSGEHVNPGYFEDPGADAVFKTRERGRLWHRTGDAGFFDDQGRLWLLGRVGERCGGLWPLPVEAAAERLPFVRKAGLIEVDGKAALACELDSPPEDWARRVAVVTQARPVSVPQIPVDPRHNAKVDRAALRAMLGSAD